MSDKKTPRTDDLRRELDAMPKFGQYGYSAEAFAALVFKRFSQLERELAEAQMQLSALRSVNAAITHPSAINTTGGGPPTPGGGGGGSVYLPYGKEVAMKLTAAQVEAWRNVWNTGNYRDAAFESVRGELNALCDMALTHVAEEKPSMEARYTALSEAVAKCAGENFERIHEQFKVELERSSGPDGGHK